MNKKEIEFKILDLIKNEPIHLINAKDHFECKLHGEVKNAIARLHDNGSLKIDSEFLLVFVQYPAYNTTIYKR